jgi:protein-L-isoaspartate(D-aspartate) O-methyltransferase
MAHQSSLQARQNMVECQLRPNNVHDTVVIEAFRTVPREAYLPEPLQGMAYVDEDLALGNGRYLVEPVAYAKLLQAAKLTTDAHVLDVGCVYGYSSAVLAQIVRDVVAVDASNYIDTAQKTFKKHGIDNVTCVAGKLTEGAAKHAPFDAIIINGAVETLPKALCDQLREQGAVACFMRDVQKGTCMGTVYRKVNEQMVVESQFDAFVPVLQGFEQAEAFVF